MAETIDERIFPATSMPPPLIGGMPFGLIRGRASARLASRMGNAPSTSAAAPATLQSRWPISPVPDELWRSIDFGCGAGADLCISALMAGDKGKVYGIELTPAMAEKARRNLALAGARNFQVLETDMAATSLWDGCADVVISNGSINLSAGKECVLKEIHRVLRRGGRLYLADIVREKGGEEKQCGESWANCVSGTLEPDHLIALLNKAGFSKVGMISFTGYRTSPTTVGALFHAGKN